jgi:hypothetical protein
LAFPWMGGLKWWDILHLSCWQDVPFIVTTAPCTVVWPENHMEHGRRKRCIQRKPSVLPAFGVFASVLRAGQSKGVHFVVPGSDLVTGAPIDGTVHDGWPIDH